MTKIVLFLYTLCELAGCVMSTVFLSLRSSGKLSISLFAATLGYWVCIPAVILFFAIFYVVFLVQERKR